MHIAVDGATKVPLGVQVFARGRATPAVDVAFTRIRFARPGRRNFAFTPPPGAHGHDGSHADGARDRPGSGTPRLRRARRRASSARAGRA